MNDCIMRGDIFCANLNNGIGAEQRGYRPVLIIQNNTGNKFSPTVRSVYKGLHADRETGC